MILLSGNTYDIKDLIKSVGGRWSVDGRCWSLPDDRYEEIKEEVGNHRGVEVEKKEDPKPAEKVCPVYIGAPDGVTPYNFQVEGVEWSLQRDKGIIADEMGLGKTVQALLSARSAGIKTIVVCPASVKKMWEIEKDKWAPEVDLEVVSWGMVKKVNPKTVKESFLIFDEAHYAKAGKKSQRGDSFLKLCGAAKRVLLLTGTPILNRPIDLFPLLKAIGSPLSKNWVKFVERYCAGERTRFGWDVSGASNLDELSERAKGSMIRRERKNVLPDLADKSRSIYSIEPCKDLKALVDREKDLADKEKKAKDLKGKKEAFAEISKIRAKIALLKVPESISRCEDLLEFKEKVVVFWHHKEPLIKMKKYFEKKGVKLASITGEKSDDERQDAVEKFQNSDVRIIFCTYGAACEGITLTAAHTSLMCECSWTPAKMLQAEDRTCRIGQKNSVEIFYLVVDGSLDARIAIVAKEKDEIISAVVGGDNLEF